MNRVEIDFIQWLTKELTGKRVSIEDAEQILMDYKTLDR